MPGERRMSMNTLNRSLHEGRPRAALLVLLLAGLLSLSVSSCRFLGDRPPLELDFSEGGPGVDLSVTAHFVSEADDAPGFFRSQLPDSGIVPVFVGLRNNGARPLAIYTANGLGLDGAFDGFALMVGGERYLPVSPREATARLIGEKRARRYERPGGFGIFVGTVMPPVGGFFIYREVDVGRFYRPIEKHSLYETLPSGACRPVEIAAGEVLRGYLYFDVGDGAVRDSVVGKDRKGRDVTVPVPFPGRSCELLVQPCVPSAAGDTIAGVDFRFAGSSLVALKRIGDRALELAVAPIGDDAGEPLGRFTRLASISAANAAIGAAAVHGDTVAVGLNFKSKSKVILASLADAPRSLGEEYYSRGIAGILFSRGGMLARTEDGYCRVIAADGARRGAYVRLGAEVTDAVIVGDELAAFQRKRGLALFGAAPGHLLEPLGGKPLSAGRREAIGFLDDKLVVLNRGAETAGDTIALFMREGLSEIRRMALPGHVTAAACGASRIVLQIEDGTLLDLASAPLAHLEVASAAYLPIAARALARTDWGFIAVSDSGVLAAGRLERYAPGGGGMLEVRAPVR